MAGISYSSSSSYLHDKGDSTEEEEEDSDSDGEILGEEIVNVDGESEMILVPQKEVSH